ARYPPSSLLFSGFALERRPGTLAGLPGFHRDLPSGLREPEFPGVFWADTVYVCGPKGPRVVHPLAVQLLAKVVVHEYGHRLQLLRRNLVGDDSNPNTRPRIHVINNLSHVRFLLLVFRGLPRPGASPVSAADQRAI